MVCLVQCYADMGGIDRTTPTNYGSIAAVLFTPSHSRKNKKTLSAVVLGGLGLYLLHIKCRVYMQLRGDLQEGLYPLGNIYGDLGVFYTLLGTV